jgi:ABC-type lipoprotein release transport system permease subunit
MGTLLVIAWRNLWRGWRRSAIVLLAITVGLSACLLLVGWSHGMVRQMIENAVSTRLGHLVVMAQGYQKNPDVMRNLPDDGREIAAALERFAGAHASPRLVGDGLLQSARRSSRVVILGVDPLREARVSVVASALVEGHMPQAAAAESARRLPGIAIGAAMAERLRIRLGDKVVAHVPGEVGLGAFRVSGIFRTASSEFDRAVAYVRLEDAQHLLALPGRVTEVAVSLDDSDALPALHAHAVAELALRDPGAAIEVLTWQEREPRLAAMLALMASMSWIIYAAVFVAMAFGIANALLMMVYERIREFGVLRALGLQARALLALVLLESILMTLAGTLLGLAVGVPLVLWLGRVGIDLSRFAAGLTEFGIGTRIYTRIELVDIALPIAVALATAVLAALWPAWKAVSLRPSEAIRHV